MPTIKESIGTRTLSKLLGGRKALPQQFYKADDDASAVLIDVPLSSPTVDEGEMAIHNVVISTPASDRVSDILIPSGIVLDTYKGNPVVLWDHGFSAEDGGSMPIAMSEDKQGNLAVTFDEQAVTASAYFHGKTALSSQVFSLVATKAIRAASVRPEPIISELIVDAESDQLGILMQQWGLAEWSFVAVGCNQEALVKAIRDRRLDGEKLASPLLKSFSHLDTKPVRGSGMSLKKKTVAKSASVDDMEDDAKRAKMDGETDETPEEVVDQVADSGDMPAMKYGAQYLSAMYAGIKELMDNAAPGMATLENENVIGAVKEAMDSLENLKAAIEGVYSSEYADMPSLGGDKEEQPTEDEAMQEERMKSFLQSGLLVQARYKGGLAKLSRLLTAKGLTSQERRLLKESLDGFERLSAESKHYEDTKTVALMKSLMDRVDALQKRINDQTPAAHVLPR